MVSIVMPAFNSGMVIEKAIASVLDQKYTDWELIIVDDMSTDNTFSIAAEYAERYSNIRCIRNYRGKGVSGARNSGIYNALGEYIAFLDSDDEWLDCHLLECMNALKKFNYSFCSALWYENQYGKIMKIGENGWFDHMFNQMKNVLGVDRNKKVWLFDERLFKFIVETEFYCFHINTVVIKKSIIKKSNGFNEKLKTSEDLEFIYRILQHTNLLTVNNYHFVYNYGLNNAYAFCLRNEMSYDELRKPDVSRKLSLNVIGKMQLNMKMKDLINNSPFIDNKKQLLDLINKKIYERIMTYIWLNKKYELMKCFKLFLKSLKYIRYNEDHCFWPNDRCIKEHLRLD